jgi:hypothetical protein
LRGYVSFLGNMLDSEDDVIFVAEQDGAIIVVGSRRTMVFTHSTAGEL